jgi:YVTN family beta-propeller protein
VDAADARRAAAARQGSALTVDAWPSHVSWPSPAGASRPLAVAPNGEIWVVNRGSASISVINPGALAVTRTVALPRASAPYGLAFAPGGAAAYVSLRGGNPPEVPRLLNELDALVKLTN